MTMGDSWSYVPNDNYKSTRTLVHMLCDVVAKGGSLLLNVGPDADGQIPAPALLRMKEIGEWMAENSSSIYSTRPLYPYAQGDWRMTQSKDGKTAYMIYLVPEGSSGKLSVELPKVEGKVKSCKVFGEGKVKGSSTLVIPDAKKRVAVVVEVKKK